MTLNNPALFVSDKKEKDILLSLIKDIPDENVEDLGEAQQHTININLIDYFLERLESNELLTDLENFVLHSILPTHFDTFTDKGKTAAIVELYVTAHPCRREEHRDDAIQQHC